MNRFTLSRRRQSGTKQPARARPVLELLEDRTVLSTLTVLNVLDSGVGSLRDAIKAASSLDKIVFAPSLSGQTITLTSGELAITKSLDIEGPTPGPDGKLLLAISGNNQSRVFDISQNQKPVAVTIAHLTIEDGHFSEYAGGGIMNRSSTLTLRNDVISNNVIVGKSYGGSGAGGAVFNGNGGTLVVTSCSFSDNQALGNKGGNGEGGAIANFGATATITGSSFTGNLVQGGDGGSIASGHSVIGLYFMDEGVGGAISNNGTLTISGGTFTGNIAQGGSNATGGSGGTGRIGGGLGGALDAFGGVATVTGATFSGNQARGGNGNTAGSGSVEDAGSGFGGAVESAALFAQSLSVAGCTFTSNQALGGKGNTGDFLTGDGLGGGLSNTDGGTATVTTDRVTGRSCSFTGNSATGGTGAAGQDGGDGLGGGLYSDGTSTLTVTGTMISGNYAKGGAAGSGGNGGNGLGGGFYNSGIANLDSSTIDGNGAVGGAGSVGGNGFGGGIYVASGGNVSLTAATITGNYANGGSGGAGNGQGIGGGVYSLGALTFDNKTIIKTNHASTSNDDIFGSYTIS